MASKEKCCKCNRIINSSKENLHCGICKIECHLKCGAVPEELFHKILELTNFFWCCGSCKSSLKEKRDYKIIKEKQSTMETKIELLQEGQTKLIESVNNFSAAISNTDIMVGNTLESKMSETIGTLKDEIKVQWASVVSEGLKKGVKGVNKDTYALFL